MSDKSSPSPALSGALLALLLTAALPAGAGEFPAPAFVTLKHDNAVVAFPAQRVWAGGPDMLYDAVTPDGATLLVTSPSSNSVYAFATDSGRQQAVIAVGKAPKGVKISPDGRLAYVSNEGDASISVVDLASWKVVGRIATEQGPHNVRFSADGKTAYVTLQGSGGLGVIDTGSRKMTRVIPLPGLSGPHNLDLSADGRTAFVRDIVHSVAAVDLASGKVEKILPVGNGHAGIDVTPDGRYVFTGAIGDEVVTVIDPRTLSVIKRIEVGSGPHGVRASRDSRWVYVSVTAANKVVVIDTRTLAVAKEIPVGQFPFWVAVRGNP